MTVAYRRATAADARTIHGLLAQMAAEVGRGVTSTPDSLRAAGFGPEPRFRAVLAERAGEALGFALVYPEFSSWRGEVGLYVQDLYVRPDARGARLAAELLSAALDEAADWAPTYMSLMVDHRNLAAQAWYAKRGFALRERGDLLILEGPAMDRLRQPLPGRS